MGDRSNHGAFSPEGTAYSCFRCGKHSVKKVIATFTSWQEAWTLVKEYSDTLSFYEGTHIERASAVKWPPDNSVEMPSLHAQYLHKRGYDPKQLRDLYGVQCVYQTGAFKYRVVIPVYVGGKIVTYVGRDVTDKASLKYKNLSERNSILPVKETVYNLDSIHKTAIICEGIFDAWRFGAHGVCVFGLQFTASQTKALATRIERAFIVFDAEPTAYEKALELGEILSFQGVDVEVIGIDMKDPGEMSQAEADEIKHELLL